VTNPIAAKGARFERDIRAFLSAVFGKLVRRPRQEGVRDVGDIHLSPLAVQPTDRDNLLAGINDGVYTSAMGRGTSPG